MEDNTNTNINTETQVEDGTVDTTGTGTETNVNTADSVTMSKTDYDKAIQSAEDKVRGKLSKRIKELEEEVKRLSPVQKTEAELELEARIAKLEESERLVAEQKARLDFQEKLTEKNVSKELFPFIKEDADIEALATVLDSLTKANKASSGYVPGEHDSGESVSLEEFKTMSYSQKEELMRRYPETYKRLRGMK